MHIASVVALEMCTIAAVVVPHINSSVNATILHVTRLKYTKLFTCTVPILFYTFRTGVLGDVIACINFIACVMKLYIGSGLCTKYFQYYSLSKYFC